jgi:hypothetical protein
VRPDIVVSESVAEFVAKFEQFVAQFGCCIGLSLSWGLLSGAHYATSRQAKKLGSTAGNTQPLPGVPKGLFTLAQWAERLPIGYRVWV